MTAIATTAVLLLVLGVSDAPSAVAGDRYRARLLALVNASRERHDLTALGLDRDLSVDARNHTRTMLRRERIFDPAHIREILRGRRFHVGAATVGCAPSLRALLRAWMRSKEHREILLHPDLEDVGLGVIRPDRNTRPCGAGAIWATGIYYG